MLAAETGSLVDVIAVIADLYPELAAEFF